MSERLAGKGVATGLLAAALTAALGCGAAARADEPGDPPIAIAAALPPPAGRSLAGAVLVGRSGQLYYPAAPGLWQRRAGGGVAVEVRGAVSAPAASGDGDVLVIGLETPPFRFAGGSWRAEPLGNRGPAALSATGAPTLVVGRHVYVLQAGAWVHRLSAASRVSAAWCPAPGGPVVVAAADGGLSRAEGRRLQPLRSPLSPDDPITAMIGTSATAVYGRAQTGAWVRIDRGAAVALTPAADLAGFEEQAAGSGPDGRLWLAGTLPGAGGGRRAVLARAERDQLLLAGDIPAPPGDPLAVLIGQATTGELLVATRTGAVRIRDKKGTWSEGSTSGALPAATRHAGGGSGAPARTR